MGGKGRWNIDFYGELLLWVQGGVAQNCPVGLLDPCWHFEGAMWWLEPSSAPGVPQQLQVPGKVN